MSDIPLSVVTVIEQPELFLFRQRQLLMRLSDILTNYHRRMSMSTRRERFIQLIRHEESIHKLEIED